jgi:hypothetical protein
MQTCWHGKHEKCIYNFGQKTWKKGLFGSFNVDLKIIFITFKKHEKKKWARFLSINLINNKHRNRYVIYTTIT